MLDTIKDKVEHILKNFPETRTNDKMLIARFYLEFHKRKLAFYDGAWLIPISQLLSLTSSDSITRWRRKFQEKGEYTNTEHDSTRYAQEVAERNYHQNN